MKNSIIIFLFLSALLACQKKAIKLTKRSPDKTALCNNNIISVSYDSVKVNDSVNLERNMAADNIPGK